MRFRPRTVAAALLAAFLTFGFVPSAAASPRNERDFPEKIVHLIKKLQKLFRIGTLEQMPGPPIP